MFHHWLIMMLILVISTSCSRRASRVETAIAEQILHMANGDEPQGIDPHVVTGIPEHNILASILEGLVSEDPQDLHPVPGVAERWEISGDGRVYTFFLRDNAEWSNGDPVTASDFLRSYQRMLTPTLAAQYAYMLYVVKNAESFNTGKIKDFSKVGFKVIDERTLQIVLENATPYFLSLLNHYSWFPVHIPTVLKYGKLDERGTRWTRPGHFVGNGPFRLKSWKLNQVLIVEKSPTYWDRETVRLNEIHFYPITSEDAEERAFRSGQIHLTYDMPLSKIDYYRENKPDLLRIDTWLGNYFYRMNTRRPPLDDVRVRKALAFSIDRRALVENVTRGGQLPGNHLTPPGTGGYFSTASIPFDPDQARQLLSEAGYPNGQGFPKIELLYNNSEMHRQIAVALQQMWKKNINVEISLLNQEWKVYMDSMKQMNYDIVRSGWIGDYPDPNTFMDLWVTDGGNNRTGWSHPEYDRLIREASGTLDETRRFELFDRAENLVIDEVPFLPLYFYTRVFLIHPSVQGWHATILDHHPYKYVYLEDPVTATDGTVSP